jgi:hypothetical protein
MSCGHALTGKQIIKKQISCDYLVIVLMLNGTSLFTSLQPILGVFTLLHGCLELLVVGSIYDACILKVLWMLPVSSVHYVSHCRLPFNGVGGRSIPRL